MRELGVIGYHLIESAVAIELGDVDRAREIGRDLATGGDRGKLGRSPQQEVAEGAVRVMTGDDAGLAQVDVGIAALRTGGLRFLLAVALRARAMLAPGADGAASAADEARAILTGIGAVTLLRGLPAASTATPSLPSEAPSLSTTGSPARPD